MDGGVKVISEDQEYIIIGHKWSLYFYKSTQSRLDTWSVYITELCLCSYVKGYIALQCCVTA